MANILTGGCKGDNGADIYDRAPLSNLRIRGEVSKLSSRYTPSNDASKHPTGGKLTKSR
jgi:hypothetical protein